MAMLLVGCAAGAEESVDPPTTTSTTATTASTTTTTPSTTQATATPETLPPGAVTDAAIFLASIDDAMAGTSYEGVVFEEPEQFLSTGGLFCELLGDGLTIEEVLTAYLLALDDALADEVTVDDQVLGGVVLGAAVETLCTEHRELL